MTTETLVERTILFGDDGSSGADLAWLWINSHRWPGWRIEVLTAIAPTGAVVSERPAPPYEWESPAPRSAFAETPFPTLPLYSGDPWFVPMAMRYFDWKDRKTA